MGLPEPHPLYSTETRGALGLPPTLLRIHGALTLTIMEVALRLPLSSHMPLSVSQPSRNFDLPLPTSHQGPCSPHTE